MKILIAEDDPVNLLLLKKQLALEQMELCAATDGYDAFKKSSNYLKNNKDYHEFGMVAYKVSNTLTENGSVKRGVCFSKNNFLNEIIESKVSEENKIITCEPLDGGAPFTADKNTIVSMNMFLFTPYIFELLDHDIIEYFKNSADLTKGEFLIPDVIFNNIKSGKVKVKIIDTSAKWCGVTYKEDTDTVKSTLINLSKKNVYPKKLW